MVQSELINKQSQKMKKCSACQKEIDDKAKKCPHCQSDLRNWFVKHPFVTIILVFIVIGIANSSGGAKKSDNVSNTNSAAVQQKATTPEVKPEAMKITAKQLADDFDENQVAAEKKWENKLVTFTATVSNITEYGISFSNIASKQFSMSQISCKISDKDQLLSLKNGQSATVKGVVGGQTIGVIDLKDCEVVK